MTETFEIRAIFMPYCLIKQATGHYVIVNRKYKPLGISSNDWVDYSLYAKPIKGLGPATIRKLSFNGDSNPEVIYFYNDGCVPTAGHEAMDGYLQRLAILAKLKVG